MPGWNVMPNRLSGFSQTHVSGTGGGPKYGNILVRFEGERTEEDIQLGYYSCTLNGNRRAEITTAERASFYRFTGVDRVEFDLQHFLGRNPVPKAREAQQYEDSYLDVVNDSVQCGWQRISGGWNNGGPYTVYFYSVSKKQAEHLLLRIGISFVSIDKARQNLIEDIPHWDFRRTYDECIRKWDDVLSRVQIDDEATAEQRRMFYTALYHTMLMPVDRTKDNGLYDDYYAIWDTYRTNTPLLTLIAPECQTAIARSLLDIYRLTGYMPDARSGNSNGRTQGGSNAEIVIADALAKGLKLDYNLALEAMLKDATVPPTDDEAEGRGGLAEYNCYGYIPYGIPRAGNRTVEYAFDDWAIAQVAKSLGRDSLYNIYMAKSKNWKNLWRKDYEQDGAIGFIMPKEAPKNASNIAPKEVLKEKTGIFLDSVPFGHSCLQKRSFAYTPEISYEGPWYCAWWDCFMYEASSWEYSLKHTS